MEDDIVEFWVDRLGEVNGEVGLYETVWIAVRLKEQKSDSSVSIVCGDDQDKR